MRKKIFFTFFFLSALILTGCSQRTEAPTFEEEERPEEHQQEEEVAPTPEEPVEEEPSEFTEPDEESDREEERADIDTEDWRLYSQELKQVEIKYPQNWYHRRALTEELDNDYYLFVEFADNPGVWEGQATSTIQLIGIDREREVEEQEYFKEITMVGDRKFFLRTNNVNFKEIVDSMSQTFKFLLEE